MVAWGRVRSWEIGIGKGRKETSGGDGYVHWLDPGDGFVDCVYIITYQMVNFKLYISYTLKLLNIFF